MLFIDLCKAEPNRVTLINLQWFQSFLENHEQYLKTNCESPSMSVITCSAPRESILRPLLFKIYVAKRHPLRVRQIRG